MHSEKLKDLFLTNFTPATIQQLYSSKEEVFLQSRAELKNGIDSFFLELNLFILSGEYIDTQKLEDLISFLIQELDKLINDLNNEDLTGEIYESFFVPMRYTVKVIESLKKIINRKLSRENSLILIEGRKSFRVNQDSDWMDFSEQIQFLEINCEITSTDHNLSVKDNHLSSLIINLLNLEKKLANSLPLKNILIEKCKLLISKISNRLEEDDKSYLYSYEFNDNEISNFKTEISVFKDFLDLSDSHYLEANKKNRINEINRILDTYKKGEIDLKEYHSLIKHYKDDNQNFTQVKNLFAEFEKQYNIASQNDQICRYDKRSWAICYNYLINNTFSSLINKKTHHLIYKKNILKKLKVFKIKRTY